MAQDYANKSRTGKNTRRRRSTRQRRTPPSWTWLLAGLFVGLFVAFLFYLSHQPVAHITLRPETILPRPKPFNTHLRDARDVHKSAPQALPGPADQGKPHFDFYTILPDMEVQVPNQALDKSTAKGGKPVLDAHATYVLQVGAFRSGPEAESLKARLALTHGIQADVQVVTIDGQTWHRVRLGPFKGLAELNAARTRLKRDKVVSIVLKLKG